jgi:Putative cell wall-binding domain
MKKAKKALASLAIAGMALTMIPFNALADDAISTRLAGNTAVQTAQAISQDYLTSSQYAVVAPAAAYNMVDALAAAPLAAALNAPVLLSNGDQLSPEAKSEITRLGVKTVYVTSGLAVLKAGVIADLQGMGVTVINLGGYDQYETSVNIAKEIAKINPTTSIFLANGESARVAQDALSVASIAGAQKQPLLLTQKGQLPQVVADYINSIKASVTTSYITGGTGVISDDIKAELPGTVYRNAGYDAYDTNLAVLENFTTLNYDRVFVANGETMIDALAGAPLAAQTDSPIVLVNGSVKTAMTDYLNTKETASTVVTALGGEAVVPEALRTTIANPGQPNVTDVEGTTSNVFIGDNDPVLGFSVGGVEKTVSDLTDAGYTVEFQATQPIFYGDNYDSSDGIVNMGATGYDLSTEGNSFNYKVVISKGDNVITSDFKKVTVKAAESGTAAIKDADIFLSSSDIQAGDPVQIKSGHLTLDDDAYLRVRGTDADNAYSSITDTAEYSTSDPSIAYVDKSSSINDGKYDYAPIVLGGSTGSVTITITTSDGTKQTLNLTVSDETRKVSASKTVIDKPSNLKLGGPDTSEAIAVTVNDQFGDPIKDYTINPKDAISTSDTIAQAVAVAYDETNPVDYSGDVSSTDASTDNKGRVVVLVEGGADDGTASMSIQDEDSNTLGTLSVTNRAASGTATDYDFEVAPFRVSTLDASDSVDDVTYLNIDGYDSSGYKTISDFSNDNLTIKVDGDKVSDTTPDPNKYVTVDTSNIAEGYIKVTAKKVTTSPVTIALYQGDSSIKLASTTLNVTDTRSKITGATFESGIPTIYSATGIKLDSVLLDSNIKTDSGNKVTYEYLDENTILIKDVDNTIIGDLKLSVLDGDLTPTFTGSGTSDDPYKIAVAGDDGESGTIRLTVNRLTGDSTATDSDGNAIPANAASVANQNITVSDLAN